MRLPEPEQSSPRTTVFSIELEEEGRPALLRWCTWEPPWGHDGHNDSYALVTGDGPILVDPEDPGAAGEWLWSSLGRAPRATLLTTDWHERGAYILRERFGTPVWAPAEGLPVRGGALEGEPDHCYEDGAALPGGLRALRITGTGQADYVLAGEAPGGIAVLFSGDVLNGAGEPRHSEYARLPRRRPGLYAGASQEYFLHRDPEQVRRGLARLLTESCDIVCGGHGTPYGHAPAHAIARLLALDWLGPLTVGQDIVVYAHQNGPP
ncbi:MAG: MBL fold metallo-hydrolase [Chloroflexota bacterium]